MAILSDSHRQKVREMFDAQLKGPVTVLFFHDGGEADQFTAATREILGELANLAGGRITVREVVAAQSPALAGQYQIEQVPALALLAEGDRDTNMRFYGAPVGYEFMVLLEDLIDVSVGQTRLTEGALAQLRAIDQPVTIQVYTTPT